MDMEYALVYMTATNANEAEKIAHHLVEQRLAACVNILGKVQSIYRWEGKLKKECEISLIAKTRSTLVVKLIDAVKALHSYSCPCVITLPILEGNPDFLSFIARETA